MIDLWKLLDKYPTSKLNSLWNILEHGTQHTRIVQDMSKWVGIFFGAFPYSINEIQLIKLKKGGCG